MVEWEQEGRAAEVGALQLALKEKDGQSVLRQTRVSAVHLSLLNELHPMALSWRVTPKACAVSLCLLSCSMSTSAFARPKLVLPTVDVALALSSAVYLWLQITV